MGSDGRQRSALPAVGGRPTLTGDEGAACFADEQAAGDALASTAVREVAVRYCVVSSADEDLGCYVSRSKAESRLQETGQERLLQVIGTTARLEEREVLGVQVPTDETYDATPVTCVTAAERDSEECSFGALRDQDVVFGEDGETKYQLGPVRISGDAIRRRRRSTTRRSDRRRAGMADRLRAHG
jgi:hypothetical protein